MGKKIRIGRNAKYYEVLVHYKDANEAQNLWNFLKKDLKTVVKYQGTLAKHSIRGDKIKAKTGELADGLGKYMELQVKRTEYNKFINGINEKWVHASTKEELEKAVKARGEAAKNDADQKNDVDSDTHTETTSSQPGQPKNTLEAEKTQIETTEPAKAPMEKNTEVFLVPSVELLKTWTKNAGRCGTELTNLAEQVYGIKVGDFGYGKHAGRSLAIDIGDQAVLLTGETTQSKLQITKSKEFNYLKLKVETSGYDELKKTIEELGWIVCTKDSEANQLGEENRKTAEKKPISGRADGQGVASEEIKKPDSPAEAPKDPPPPPPKQSDENQPSPPKKNKTTPEAREMRTEQKTSRQINTADLENQLKNLKKTDDEKEPTGKNAKSKNQNETQDLASMLKKAMEVRQKDTLPDDTTGNKEHEMAKYFTRIRGNLFEIKLYLTQGYEESLEIIYDKLKDNLNEDYTLTPAEKGLQKIQMDYFSEDEYDLKKYVHDALTKPHYLLELDSNKEEQHGYPTKDEMDKLAMFSKSVNKNNLPVSFDGSTQKVEKNAGNDHPEEPQATTRPRKVDDSGGRKKSAPPEPTRKAKEGRPQPETPDPEKTGPTLSKEKANFKTLTTRFYCDGKYSYTYLMRDVDKKQLTNSKKTVRKKPKDLEEIKKGVFNLMKNWATETGRNLYLQLKADDHGSWKNISDIGAPIQPNYKKAGFQMWHIAFDGDLLESKDPDMEKQQKQVHTLKDKLKTIGANILSMKD